MAYVTIYHRIGQVTVVYIQGILLPALYEHITGALFHSRGLSLLSCCDGQSQVKATARLYARISNLVLLSLHSLRLGNQQSGTPPYPFESLCDAQYCKGLTAVESGHVPDYCTSQPCMLLRSVQVLGITNYSHWNLAGPVRQCLHDEDPSSVQQLLLSLHDQAASSSPSSIQQLLLSLALKQLPRFVHVGIMEMLDESIEAFAVCLDAQCASAECMHMYIGHTNLHVHDATHGINQHATCSG